jgi:hypothetical protein
MTYDTSAHKWVPLLTLIGAGLVTLALQPILGDIEDLELTVRELQKDNKTYSAQIAILEQKTNRIDKFGSSFLNEKGLMCMRPEEVTFGTDWSEHIKGWNLSVRD